jgi:hypothetical protein
MKKKRIALNLDKVKATSGDPWKDAMLQMFMAGVKAGIEAVQDKPAGRPKGSARALAFEDGLRRYVLVERRVMRGMKKTMAAKDLAKKDPRAWRTIVRHYDDATRRLREAGLLAGVDWALFLEYTQTKGLPLPSPESLPPEWREAFALKPIALPQEPVRRVAK